MTKEEALRRMKEAGEDGNLIESGWIAHIDYYAPPGVSNAQRQCMRHSFFLGVRHMLEMIQHARDALEDGVVTELDCEDLIETVCGELKRFEEANAALIISEIQGVSRH